MSKLQLTDIQEFQKRYIESLETWIEIAVFDQDAFVRFIQSFDVEDKELSDYRQYVVENWPGIPSRYKRRLSEPKVVGEVYEEILHLNPAVHPKNVWALEPVEQAPEMDEEDKKKIMRAFASGGTLGPKIQVIHGGKA